LWQKIGIAQELLVKVSHTEYGGNSANGLGACICSQKKFVKNDRKSEKLVNI
jgi:hypothetical protein